MLSNMKVTMYTLLTLILLQTPPGAAIDPAAFRFSREISKAPGLSRVVLDAAVLAHSRADLGDLRIVDTTNQQIPYLLENLGAVLTIPISPLVAEEETAPPRHSYYRLVLPFESLPRASLILATDDRVFARSIALKVRREYGQARSEPVWETVESSTWSHADPKTSARALTLSLGPRLGTTEVRLDVEEGDNRPLTFRDVYLELPTQQLRFFYPDGERLTLRYGQTDLAAPRYDLELLADRLVGESSHEVALGVEQALPVTSKTETATVALWIALGVAVVVILALLVRLLRTAERQE